MLKQMAPSDAPTRAGVMPMVFDEGIDQRAGDLTPANERIDELIIDKEQVPLLERNIKKINDTFNVKVELGLAWSEDGQDRQWIEIKGSEEDRTAAKSYVKALCTPGSTYRIHYPDDIHANLSSPTVHNHIEKQSNAVVLFPAAGQALIQGQDELAITLATSLIEDLIHKFHESQPSSPTAPIASNSTRIDQQLRRLSSQNKEQEEYGESELHSMHPAVKRTILKHYMYDPDACKTSTNNDPSVDKDQTVPMRLMNSGATAGFSQPAFVNLHPEQKTATKAQPTRTSPSDHSKYDSDSLSLTLHLGNSASMPEKRAPMIDLDRVKNSELIDLTADSPPVSEGPGPSQVRGGVISEARKYALNKGYTTEEIEVVETEFGDLLHTSEFIEALVTNRRLKAEKHALSVSELEAAQFGRPKPSAAAGKDPTEASNPWMVTPVKSPTQSSEEGSPELGAMAGKQPNEVQAHNQGPKSKKGKHIKNVQAKAAKKKARKSRWSPVDPALNSETADNQAVENSSARHPLEEILQGRSNYDLPQAMSYFEELSREENCNDLQELRKKKAIRLGILEQCLKRNEGVDKAGTAGAEKEGDDNETNPDWIPVGRGGRPQKAGNAEEDDDEETDQDWVTRSRGGRSKKEKVPDSVKAPHKTTPGKKGPASNTKRNGASGSGNAVGGSLFNPPAIQSDPKGHQLPMNILDEFSLPYSINAQPAPRAVQPVHTQPQLIPPTGRLYNQPLPPGSFSPPRPAWYDQQQPQQQQQQQRPGASTGAESNLRYIVIDGSNVAMTHGNHKYFSCKGIKICIDYFKRRGHKEVTAFVPQSRTRFPRSDQPIRDQHLLEEMRQEGSLVFTPARRVPGKNIVCYDDKFVLRLAQETDGIMVSNDNYRDLWHEKQEWRKLIEERLLMFSFVGDIFMPPDDPLGQNGPALDAFLRKNGHEEYLRNNPPQEQFSGKQKKLRDPGQTQWLRKKVLTLFPTEEHKLLRILEENPCVTNLNRIVDFMLNSY